MPNGKILCALSPTPTPGDNYPAQTFFYEYDYSVGTGGQFTQILTPDGSQYYTQPSNPFRMLVLPDGTVMMGSSIFYYAYQPDGAQLSFAEPKVESISLNGDGSLHLRGEQFTGISQGASYGDDAQMDSNFPIVRFTDLNGNVRYGRTYNWDTTAVATGTRVDSTDCALPPGASLKDEIRVIANGIVSEPAYYNALWLDFNYVNPYGFYLGTFDSPFRTIASAVNAAGNGGTIAIKSSSSTDTIRITKPLRLVSVYGPSRIGH